MDFKEIVCEDRLWIELAQDRVQLWALVLEALNLRLLLFVSHLTECMTRYYVIEC
jgi:hypothetical protein